MRDRRRFGRQRRRSLLGSLIEHDPEMVRPFVLLAGVLAYLFYASGQLELALAELKAGLVARLTEAAPLLLDVGSVALAVAAVLALLVGAGVVRLAPGDGPRARRQLALGRGRRGLFLVRPDERRAHMTVVGLSGMGKSKAVAAWVAQDIRREREASLVLDIHQ